MIDAKTFARYAADPAAFRAGLLVDADGSARRFGDIQDDWQRADFAALDSALLRSAGRKAEGETPSRAYLERPRGHSKTTDLAVTCAYGLAFAARPLRGYAFAADQDQAGLLKDSIATLCRLNPWLGSILSIEKNRVVNKAPGHPGEGGTLTISTSDVGSSYGILPDLIIADELCHWQGDGALWHSLISSAAKRQSCLLVVISNAGFADSWQWNVREAARTDPAWHFSRLDGPQASWMTPERLAEQARMLPSVAYARLWLNEWSSGGGDALTEADIKAAFVDGLAPMTGEERDYRFAAGIDLGLKRDSSAVVVLAAHAVSGRIRLANHKLWRPPKCGKVNLLDVEQSIRELDRRYSLVSCAFDPWQAEHLAQRLEADHRSRAARRHFGSRPWMREVPPTADNLRAMCSSVIESFQDRRLELYDCEPLRRDLHKLRVEEKSYGCRLSSPRDGTGHGDSASAFAIALLAAHEAAGRKTFVVGRGGVSSSSSTSSLGQAWEQRQRAYEQLTAVEAALAERPKADLAQILRGAGFHSSIFGNRS